MSSSFFELDPISAVVALPQRDDEVSRVENIPPERRSGAVISGLTRPVEPLAVPGALADEPATLPVQLAVRGTRHPGAEWRKWVGRVLERTLQRLLGPDAPLEPLLESALFEALSSWPPRSDQAMPLWGQGIAAAVALGHLKSGEQGRGEPALARPGSLREVLSHLHQWLRAARPQEQLAFALLELCPSSVTEAATILRAPPVAVQQRASFLRRQLLFAARRDRLLARYLRLAPRLRVLLRHWDGAGLAAPGSQRAHRLSAEIELELQWFL